MTDKQINIDEVTAGARLEYCPYMRRYWLWLLFMIGHPADIINNKALIIALDASSTQSATHAKFDNLTFNAFRVIMRKVIRAADTTDGTYHPLGPKFKK